MGDGTEQNPYTRKDVLRLIKENGGKAEGLDLSGRVFREDIDLRGFDLSGIVLKEAQLWGAHLERARLRYANLEKADLARVHLEDSNLSDANLKGAELWNAHLERASLCKADLEETQLSGAHMEGVFLRFARLSHNTKLLNVNWGNYRLKEEFLEVIGKKKLGAFDAAAEIYRRLKVWYANAGMYDISGNFYYREREANRIDIQEKISQRFNFKLILELFWLWIYKLTCGYGEIPWRVLSSAAVIIIGLAFIYFAIGTLTPNTFLNSLYYSAVSFSALGYGKWAPEPAGWVKGLGVIEAFVGVFMMSLFLITFVRKLTR
jgi:hypothetical protein